MSRPDSVALVAFRAAWPGLALSAFLAARGEQHPTTPVIGGNVGIGADRDVRAAIAGDDVEQTVAVPRIELAAWGHRRAAAARSRD